MQRLIIDMDEVMADAIGAFIQYYNKDYGVPLDLQLDAGNEIYEHVPEEGRKRWIEYINEPGFFRHMKPIDGVKEVMPLLCRSYDVYIVSAAMQFRNSLVDKLDWLNEHFPYIGWQNIVFCGHKIVEGDIMIDDRTFNLDAFKGRKLLFSSPHNMLIDSSAYTRVNNWQEVADLLLPGT